jgi:hypothetical protein
VLFSPGQRDLAIRAMDEAEERTIAYYCIPPFQWQRLKYDLLTCQDHEWEPLPEAALARVQRLSQLRPSCKTACDFYRIQLNDPSILTAARREDIESDLYPFLIYILTHEMVHLVRLSTILPDEPTFHGSPDAEEGLVQKVAYRILSGAPDRKLDPILSKFCTFKPKYTPDSKFEIENLES